MIGRSASNHFLYLNLNRYVLQKEMRFAFPILICVAVVAVGVRFLTLSPPVHDAYLDETLGKEVSFEALIIREPTHKENNQRIVVGLPSDARVTISAERYPKFEYGDYVKLSGKVRLPESFETESGRMFAYDSYLEKDGIAYQMLYPKTELISRNNGNVLFEALFKVRRAFLSSIRTTIPEPHASLVLGITIGVEDGLGKKFEDLFRTVGIIHIIVLSGYNITIVSEFMARAFKFLPHKLPSILGIMSVVLFVIMAGASAATIRAAIMAILVVVARLIDRPYNISRALLIAGGVMVFHNPHILFHDPSFQLSFLATLGLVYGTPLVARVFVKLPETFGIRESATTTAATQLFVLPLLLYQTGQMSVVALPANILVLWSMPFIMATTFGAGVIGFFSSTLALPFSLIAYTFSEYVFFIAETLARLPLALFALPPFHWSLLAVMYGTLFFLVYRFTPKLLKTTH